jgi:hypothetical protein
MVVTLAVSVDSKAVKKVVLMGTCSVLLKAVRREQLKVAKKGSSAGPKAELRGLH